jgi:hypothetical protein
MAQLVAAIEGKIYFEREKLAWSGEFKEIETGSIGKWVAGRRNSGKKR